MNVSFCGSMRDNFIEIILLQKEINEMVRSRASIMLMQITINNMETQERALMLVPDDWC